MQLPSSRVASGWKLEAPGSVHPANSYLVRIRVRVRSRVRVRNRVRSRVRVRVRN